MTTKCSHPTREFIESEVIMTQLQSFMLLIIAGIIAYLLAYLFNYLDRCRVQSELKRFFKSDLNRLQATKIIKEAYKHNLQCGLDAETAYYNAVSFCEDLRKNNLLHDKYKLLKGV